MRCRLIAGLLTTCLTQPAWAQQLGGGGSPNVSLLRVFLALFVCLIIAVLAILLVRQRLGGSWSSLLPRATQGNSRIRLIENRRISPQAEVSLIACDDDEYLLLLGGNGYTVLRSAVQTTTSVPAD